MLRKIWRRFWSPAVWAFALVLAAPLLASAQQTGLFPLAPIRRERVPCPMEDPLYGLYRSQYYGYFPTCWRRFPPGWGCPSPEAPNAAQSFAEIKRDELPSVEEAPPEEGGGPEGPPRPAPGGELEPLPGGRGPAVPSPEQLPPIPGGTRSPFELEKPRPAPGPSNPNGASLTPAPAEPGTAPSLNPPGDGDESPARPGSETAARLAPAPTPAPAPAPPPVLPSPSPSPSVPTAPAERGDVLGSGPESTSPLLALPDPSGPSASTVPPGGGTPVESSGPPSLPSPTPVTPPEASTASPAPVQAPRRLSVLGNLFNAIGLKRR